MGTFLTVISLSIAIQMIEGVYYPVGIGLGGVGGGLGYGAYGGGIGLGGAGLAAGKLIGGAGLVGAGGAGLVGAGGAGLVAPGLYGAGLYGPALGGAGLAAGKLIGGAGLVGPGLVGGAGLIGGGAGLIGAPLLHGYGGEIIDKGIYSAGDKKLADASFQKASGNSGAEFNAGNAGYGKGIAAVKNAKGDSAYFNDAAAAKKIAENGKNYYGGQHFDKQGKQGGEISAKQGHKKGHVIKGFKKSHHNDEDGKTEEFFDEADDQGGKINFSGEGGSFGGRGASSFKGGLENGEFIENGAKKQGHFVDEHLFDENNANQGGFGGKKFGGSGAFYGANGGVDEHSLLGEHENSKIYKRLPFY